MKKILIIDGHPNAESFNNALSESYYQGVKEGGAEVKKIRIADLSFNPNLQYGYRQRIELEPDLLMAKDLLLWADHLVWVHPVWWGGMPAMMKGFIDRLFLPGITYQPIEGSLWWEKLLKGKTAHIITTLDQPSWYYKFAYSAPSVNQLKKTVLQFCGVKPVKVTYVGIVKKFTEGDREKWLEKVRVLGVKGK